jgi:sugar lactone lactonase YvrE
MTPPFIHKFPDSLWQAPWLLRLCATALVAGACPAFAQPQVTMQFQSMFGQFGIYEFTLPPNAVPPSGFNGPTGVAFLSGTTLLVADRYNNKVQMCSLDGECEWRGAETFFPDRHDPGTFTEPFGVSVSATGRVAVADDANQAVQICNENVEDCLFQGAGLGSSDNPPTSALNGWANPKDAVFDSQGRVIGADTDNNRLKILQPGESNVYTVSRVITSSSLDGMSQPRGIAVLADNRVVISDTGNHRILICDIGEQAASPVECTAFGRMGTAEGQFMGPVGVEVDHLGRIWIADTGNHRIQVCDEQGGCIAFGGFGTGEFQFDGPHDVAVHASGLVAVADTNSNRIQFFSTETLTNDDPKVSRLGDALDRAVALMAAATAQETKDCAGPGCEPDVTAGPSDSVPGTDKPAEENAQPIPTLNHLAKLLMILMLLGLGYSTFQLKSR